MKLELLVDADYHTLIVSLAATIAEESAAVLQRADLLTDELNRKRDTWAVMADERNPIAKAQAANYSAVDISTEIFRLDAELEVIRLKHAFIARLLMDLSGARI